MSKKIVEVFFFPNGNTAILENDRQLTELQYPWLLKFIEFLEANNVDIEKSIFNLPGEYDAVFFRTSEGQWNWRLVK